MKSSDWIVKHAFANNLGFTLAVDDVSRVTEAHGEICFVICNSGDCGWSVLCPEASRLFLDRFQESLFLSSGVREIPPIVRLRSSLRSAAKRFQRTFGRHQDEEGPDLVGPAWLTFCAVTISANRAYCVWLGENGIHLFSPTGELRSNRLTPKKLLSRQWPAPGSSIHSGQKFEFCSSVWELPASGQLILASRRSLRPREPSECQTLIGLSNQQGQAWLTQQSQMWKWYCLIAYQSPDFQPIVEVPAKQPSWLGRLAFWR